MDNEVDPVLMFMESDNAEIDLESIIPEDIFLYVTDNDERQNIVFCETCKLNFVNNDEYQKHNAELHNQIQNRCNHCNAVFKRQDSLKRHLYNVHLTTGFCICPVCGEDCKNRRYLLKHLRKIHSDRPQIFHCRDCEFVCGTFIDLEKHEKSHLPERKRFKCMLCSATFRRKDHLRRHMRYVHSSYKCTKCPICSEDCKRHSLLIIHIKKKHPKHPKNFTCNECLYECGLLTDFQKKEIPQYLCQTCKRSFKRKDHLIRHVNGEHLKQPLPCPLCNRPYKRIETVISHLRRLHKMDFVHGNLIPLTQT